jgi:hypothetical protein
VFYQYEGGDTKASLITFESLLEKLFPKVVMVFFVEKD